MKIKTKLKVFFKDLFKILRKQEMLVLPGHLAFYFVLSIVPIISIIFFIASSINLPIDILNVFIEKNFSKDVLDLVTPMLTKTEISFELLVYLGIAFFLSSNGADSIIVASNAVFNIENSNYIKRRLKAFLITILLVVLFTFILIVPMFGNLIISFFGWLGASGGIYKALSVLYPVLNIPLSFLIVFFFIKLVYTIAPDEKIPSHYVNKGAFFTTIMWVLITNFYSLYISNSAYYSLYYSGLSTIVILMLWFWFISYVFVIGLALNYRNIEERIGKTNTLKLKEIQDKIIEKQEEKIKGNVK